jgi:hypothetical protein
VADIPTSASDLSSLQSRVHRKRDAALESAALQATVQFAPTAKQEAAGEVTAILVIHGMGQQLPFETLDAVANGLNREDIRSHGAEPQSATVAHVQFGTQPLERVEMRLRCSGGAQRDVHIYEVYWAPFTEGAVTLRDVIQFLISAGVNGIKNALGRFQRWMFGDMRSFYIPVQTIVYLLITLATVVSLIVINGAIAAVTAARAPFVSAPAWLRPNLLADYTDLFTLTVGALEAFSCVLGIALLISWGRRFLSAVPQLRWAFALTLGILSLALFAVALTAIIDTAIGVPILYRAHMLSNDTRHVGGWMSDWAATIRRWQVCVLFWVAILAIAYFISMLVLSYVRQWLAARSTMLRATFALIVLVALGVSACRFIAYINPIDPQVASLVSATSLSTAITWAMLVLLSLVARMFLVQYVGDVAAYVQPQKLDRFFELRGKIKDRAATIAEAIYSQKSDGFKFDYHRVVLVGHSLGSVIVYDTLNRLLLNDAAVTAPGRPWNVAARTPYLLTFGSPLNKIAFIFSTQAKKRSMTNARERLAAVVQPIIDSALVRAGIKWVNIYSPWDIISGPLDFYDPPAGTAPPALDERDPEAVTFLAAHTEYWRNTLVFAWLHAMV